MQPGAGLSDDGPLREATAQELQACSAMPSEGNRISPRQRANSADYQQILKDLPRTFADQPEVLGYAPIIEKVLMDYAAADPEVGYCQGMNCVAAVVSTQFPDPREAFPRFRTIVASIRGLWLPGLPLFLTGMSAFEVMYQKQLPSLYGHFNAQNVTFDMFLPDAWLTLFSPWLPFALLWNAFELIEFEGFPGVLCLTVALLKAHSSALTQTQDFTSLFVLLKGLGKQPLQPEGHELLAAARELLPAAREALADIEDDRPAGKVRSCTDMSVLSVKREHQKIIHEPTGLEMILQETSRDVQMMAKAISDAQQPASLTQDAPSPTKDASSPDAVPAAATSGRRRRGGCCLPLGARKQRVPDKSES